MSWGEIYNTSWWGVALDTARTVKARPDFFGSQLNLLTSEQPNLVTNGTFDTDSDWTKGTGWTISNNLANFNGFGFNAFRQNVGLITGKIYKVTFDLNITIGNVIFQLGGTNNTFNSSATHTFYDTATANAAYSTFISLYSSTPSIFSIDNVSVQVARAELDQIEAKKCLADWIHTTALKDLNN